MMLGSTVATVLSEKMKSDVYAVPPEASLRSAALMMARHGIGSLVVLHAGRVVGILTERECVRRGLALGRDPDRTTVAQIMDEDIVCVDPHATVDRCFEVMTRYRARHLCVMHDEQIVGIISIGDVVKSLIAEQGFAIERLERYISGDYAVSRQGNRQFLEA